MNTTSKIYLVGWLLLCLSIAYTIWKQQQKPVPNPIIPSITGKEELCLSCHTDVTSISSSHPNDTFGCVRCHGGERLALESNFAHQSLLNANNPSALNTAEQSCGGESCHSGAASQARDHIPRVMKSIQVSYAGAIAQLRYAFGKQKTLEGEQGIIAVQDDIIQTSTGKPALAAFDAAKDDHPQLLKFAQNCLHCHITAQPLKDEPTHRFTGCAACHTPNLPSTSQEHGNAANYSNSTSATAKQMYHKLTTAIPYTQCNTCHNRGNYHLATMEFYPRQDKPTDRLHDYYQPIAQFVRCEWTLDCIDCHTRREVMGDGDIQTSVKDIQYIQCQTCHGTLSNPPRTHQIEDEQDLALRLAFLNPVIHLNIGDTILETNKGEPLWNIRKMEDGSYELIGKVTRQRFILPLVQNSGCLQKEDEQESRYCHKCHAVQR